MIGLICLSLSVIFTLLAGAVLFDLSPAVSDLILTNLSGHKAAVAVFFVNFSSALLVLFYFFIWLPEAERVWLWGVYLGLSTLAATAAAAALGFELDFAVSTVEGRFSISPSQEQTLVMFALSAVFSYYCTKRYQEALT